MTKKGKTLFVPDAPFRPGDKADFSDLDLPKVGSSDKPDVLVNPSEIRDLAFGLVRAVSYTHLTLPTIYSV